MTTALCNHQPGQTVPFLTSVVKPEVAQATEVLLWFSGGVGGRDSHSDSVSDSLSPPPPCLPVQVMSFVSKLLARSRTIVQRCQCGHLMAQS